MWARISLARREESTGREAHSLAPRRTGPVEDRAAAGTVPMSLSHEYAGHEERQRKPRRQTYPKTGGKTITTIAAHAA